MSNLRDIRRRLRSTENIKKITDAMERVAAARLRRAQMVAEQSRPYAQAMKSILEKLASLPENSHPLLIQRPVRKTGIIIVSSDKGLAGSYNTNLFTAANLFLKKYSPENASLILFGKKAVEHYQQRDFPIDQKYLGWTGKITLEEIAKFSHMIVNDYLSEKYDEVWLIYTHFISIASRNVIIDKFLNIKRAQASDQSPKSAENFIYEPSAAKILSEILPRYILTRLQEVLQESYASELGARIMAMQMASKNSEKMIENLILIRNKVRQENITREMIEIASGGMANS